MKEIVINKNAVLKEFCRRVNENEQGVCAHLSASGIDVTPGKITIQDINRLREINPKAFDALVRFLYPEMKDYAPGDGDQETAVITSKSGGEKWSAGDITGMVGTVLEAATGILGTLNINGNTRAVADANVAALEAAALQNEREKRQVWLTLGIVLGLFVLIVIAGVVIFKNRRH